MENYKMIIAGVIGSVITLLITAIIDYYKERYKCNMEMRKMVFQRQTDAAEKAMSWFQESIDCFRMLQMACNEINEKYNPITVEKFMCAVKQADKLYKETNLRLNPIYLYYNFVEIEKKHNIYQAGMRLSYAITEIGKMEQEAFELKSKKADDVSEEMKMLIKKELLLFDDLSKNLDIYINSLVDMQIMLRKQYQKYGA